MVGTHDRTGVEGAIAVLSVECADGRIFREERQPYASIELHLVGVQAHIAAKT